MIYTKPLYMIRVSSFGSVTLTIGYNVIPKEELPLITKKTFVSIDLERNGFEFIANHYRQDDIVARFSDLHLVFNSMEPPNTNDKYNARTLSKHIINNYDAFWDGLDTIRVFSQNKYMVLQTLRSLPILISRRHNMNWVIERKHLIKYKEFIKEIMSCNDTNYNFL